MNRANAAALALPAWATEYHFIRMCRDTADRIKSFYASTLPQFAWHLDFQDHSNRIRTYDYSFVIKSLGDQAFELDHESKNISFNQDALRLLYNRTCMDISVPSEERAFMAGSAIALYMLHELRHISQELELFSSIQDLKKIGQNELIAQFDFLADLAAAKDLATFTAWEQSDSDPKTWSAEFDDAMFIQVFYCIPSFDYKIVSNWKMGRAIGLVLVLARTSILSNLGKVDGIKRPVSAGLLVRPSQDYQTASILWIDTHWALASVIHKDMSGWLLLIATQIENKRMDVALEIGMDYLLENPDLWGLSI